MKTPRSTSSKSYHHGDLRAALLLQTVRIVEERGSIEFNLREVAKVCGVSIAAVYRHFESKNALLLAISTAGFEGLKHSLQTAAQNTHPPHSPLGKIGRAYVEFARKNEGQFRIMFSRALAALPEFKSSHALREDTFLTLVRALTAEGARKTAKSMTEGCKDPEVISHWGLVHGLAMLWLDRSLELSASQFTVVLDQVFGCPAP